MASAAIAIVVAKRIRTGHWSSPSLADVEALKDDMVRVKDRVTGRPPTPSRTIYLERGKVTLRAGRDDAARGVSSVVASGAEDTVVTPGFSGSKRGWRRIVRCIEQQFAPFDVVVTDERPDHDDFILAVVGGRAADIGVETHHVGGLAPFSGQPISRAVVFAFARKLGNRPRKVCETLTMEIGHAYGLDHAYHCPDVMTYLTGCGRKKFRDRDVPCGEHERRACDGGAPTQNSYRYLLEILGPRPAR